jgi:hypothetical protein
LTFFNLSAQDKNTTSPDIKENQSEQIESDIVTDDENLISDDIEIGDDEIVPNNKDKKEPEENSSEKDIVKESEDTRESTEKNEIEEESAPLKEKTEEEDVVKGEEDSEDILQEDITTKESKEVEADEEDVIIKDEEKPGDITQENIVTEEGEKPVDETDLNIIVEDEDIIVEDDEEESLISDDTEEETILEKETVAKEEELLPEKDTVPSEEKVTPVKEDVKEIKKADIKPEEIKTIEPDVAIEKEKIPEQKKVAVVEETRSINFAKNLKEYRSPKKAMFLSLLLPGLGQGYARRHWKIALFGLVEAALIGFSAKNYYDGKQKKKEADRFARKHYSVTKFTDFYDTLKLYVSNHYSNDSIGGIKADSFIVQGVYWGNDVDYYKDDLSQSDLENIYEEDIFVQGWDDCEPNLHPDGYDTSVNYKYNDDYYFDDSLKIKPYLNRYENDELVDETIFGYSLNQMTYFNKLSQSSRFYDIGRTLIFIMVANHIVSAVDALITARAYNDRLLSKKSVWQHINFEQQFALSETGVTSQVGIRVRF